MIRFRRLWNGFVPLWHKTMKITDPRFGLFVGDADNSPLSIPLSAHTLPPEGFTPGDLSLILSASGWRGVFAHSDEDDTPHPWIECCGQPWPWLGPRRTIFLQCRAIRLFLLAATRGRQVPHSAKYSCGYFWKRGSPASICL